MLNFSTQAEYEAYYSSEARAVRLLDGRLKNEAAVSAALQLYQDGDTDEARQCLFNAGFDHEGIAYYLDVWRC